MVEGGGACCAGSEGAVTMAWCVVVDICGNTHDRFKSQGSRTRTQDVLLLGPSSLLCHIPPAQRAVHNHTSPSSPQTPPSHIPSPPLSSNSNLNLHTRLNVDNDLLHDLSRRMKIDEALVDAHLKGIPGLGALTARRLAGGDLEVLGGQAHGALDAQVLVLGAVDELLADFLEGLDVARGEGYADLVDLGAVAEVFLGLVWGV